MSRYKTEHKLVDVSPIPLFPSFAKQTVITDTKTGKTAKGLDWDSYRESDRKAWENLKSCR